MLYLSPLASIVLFCVLPSLRADLRKSYPVFSYNCNSTEHFFIMQILRPPVAKSFLPDATYRDLLSPDVAEQALDILELNSTEEENLFFSTHFNGVQLDGEENLIPPMLHNLIVRVVDRQINSFALAIGMA